MVRERIVGRRAELRAADSFLDDVIDGARALILEGEVGIGKTTVFRAVLDRAVERGLRVLSCRADEVEARLPFVGLEELLGEVADEALPSLPPPQRAALEAALLRDGAPPASAHDPRTIGAGLTRLLGGLADRAPVVVAVDDLDWLDAPTARAVGFAIRRLAGRSVGVLATRRTPAARPDPLGLGRALAADRLTLLRLGPLDADAIRTLLADRHLVHPRPTLVRIAEVSGGNPLLALEIARSLDAHPPHGPGDPLPVPDDLRRIVGARIRRLGAEARDALLAAAASSRPPADVVERASSAEGLAAAEESGLLRVEAGRVLFAHPLYASAVYVSAATSRRRRVHGRLAELLGEDEERARHMALAASGPDEQVAAALERGAERARSRGAWEAAAELLELARAMTPPDRPADALERGIRAAEHHAHAGDRARARTLLEEILDHRLPRSSRADALRLLAEITYNDESFARARDLFAQARVADDDPRRAALAEIGLAYTETGLNRFPVAATHAHRALELAATTSDEGLISTALGVCAMLGFLTGHGVEWGRLDRSLGTSDRPVLPTYWTPEAIAALLRLFVGRIPEARERLQAIRTAATELGDESDLAFILLWLSFLETEAGDLATAAALAEEAAGLAALTGSWTMSTWVLTQQALIAAHRGDVDEVRNAHDRALPMVERSAQDQPALWLGTAMGVLELSLGDPAAAWAACEPLALAVEAHGVAEPFPLFFLPIAVEALVSLGELDRAERLLDPFEARGRELDRAWARATGGRCRALLLAARGDLDAASRAAADAVEQNERLEMPFELARTLLVQGRVRRRRREKRAAKESLERALELFDAMGAGRWAELTRTELGRLGLRRSAPDLTPTQERVASLAAAGMSAREIAAALFISPKTVQANLSKVYAKLGIRSRAELGARMTLRARADGRSPGDAAAPLARDRLASKRGRTPD